MVQGSQVDTGRPTSVTIAAWILIVLGALVTLLGLLFLIGSGFLAAALGPLAGLGVVAAIIMLAIGILHIWSGVSILGGKNWARIAGIVLGAIGVLFAILGIVGGFAAPAAVTDPATGEAVAAGGSSIVTSIIQLVLYGFVLWALIKAGNWFSR